MVRYIAVLLDPQRPSHHQAAQQLQLPLSRQPDWQLVCNQPSLTLWSTSLASVHALPMNQGALVGTLFERPHDPSSECAARLATRDSLDVQKITATRGACLSTTHWGDYVAVLHDPLMHRTRILKDPCGDLPCYLVRHRGLLIAFSRIEDILNLGVPRPCVNETYLHERVVTGGMDMLISPLPDITSIQRGEYQEFAHDEVMSLAARGLYWRPQHFATRNALLEDPATAARTLRASVRSVTRTLAGLHARALLRLSGGLDSSIIAACLAETDTDLTSYTYYDTTAVSDERRWARSAARHSDLVHEEHALDPRVARLQTLERLGPSVEPFYTLSYLERTPIERVLCLRHHATAIFTGLGGDSVFGGDALAYAASEWLSYHGPSLHFLTVAVQVAHSTQQSIARVIGRALRRTLFGSRLRDQRGALQQGGTLVNSQLLRSRHEPCHYPHPWFSAKRSVPWPLVRRVGSLLYPAHYYWLDAPPAEAAPQILSPLYAQPVIEACLRIPLYVHFLNGRERGLARFAFAEQLPTDIAQRTWKDRAPGYLETLLDNNRDYVRARLLDGVLAKRQLLDRRAVEMALARTPSRNATLPGEILRHLDTELWLRHWIT